MTRLDETRWAYKTIQHNTTQCNTVIVVLNFKFPILNMLFN